MNVANVSQQNNVLVLQLHEIDLDRQQVSPIGEQLRAIVDRSPVPNILLDLVNVSFMSSAFIGQLILLKKRCDSNRLLLKLCSITPRNREVLKLVRFDDLVDIIDDKQEALASFEEAGQGSERIHLIDGSAKDFETKAMAGDPAAQYMYGLCFETGQGVKQDIVKSLEWISKAAKQGHAQSQYKLGVAHAFGVGVPQDFSQALPWYHMAALQGLPDAQYMLGMSFQHGLGGPQDLEKAVHWYHKAADQGHVQSAKSLSNLAPASQMHAE